MGIHSEPFGTTKSGEAVTRYTLANETGMRVQVLSYGCTISDKQISCQWSYMVSGQRAWLQ